MRVSLMVVVWMVAEYLLDQYVDLAYMHSYTTSASSFDSCLSVVDKLINPGLSDLSSHTNNDQAHLD